MFSFFKKNKNDPEVPKWASFFNPKEYSLFLTELDNYFKKANIRYDLLEAQVSVDENYFERSTLGLLNVAQLCNQHAPEHYRDLITNHFDGLMKGKRFHKDFDKLSKTYEEVKKYIGVRLYNKHTLRNLNEFSFIGKEFAGDIYATIVFDFPDTIRSVQADEAKDWNKTIDELFETGIANIKAKYPVTLTKEQFPDISIWFAQADHFFVPNIVLDIENRGELIGKRGSFIGLPHRHAAIIYPIETVEDAARVSELIPAIYGMNQEGPGSISNNLFWYKDHQFYQIPYEVKGENVVVTPPERFVQMLTEPD